jgi:cytoskeletal protein RodZ
MRTRDGRAKLINTKVHECNALRALRSKNERGVVGESHEEREGHDMDVGAILRRARMRKRLTLEQIAQSTKINVGTLDALENNDFDRLPASIYTRGFLRTFAREVDLDPEETVEQFLEQCDAAAQPLPGAGAADEPESVAHDDMTGEAPRRRTIVIPRFVRIPALAAAVALVAAALYFGIPRHTGEPAVTSTAEAATAAAQPVPTPVTDVARASNAEPDILHIELTATGPCWVSATADRESALSRLLQAGEKQEIRAKDELVLRVGDPSTIAISVNGVAGRPLGRPGQPVTVQINKQNFREFQSS